MFEKLFTSLILTLDQNTSLLVASVIGSLVSVFAREERSFAAAVASFVSGVFAGWYLTQVIGVYVPIPKEPLAAVLAIMGRDLVRHIINMGRNNPMFMFDILTKLKNLPGSSSNKNVDENK